MIEFLDSIKKRDPAVRNYLEVILFYPGVHALFFYRVGRFFYSLGVPLLPGFICYFSRFLTGIEIHPAARIGKNLFIDHGFGVVIGSTAIIGDNVTIYQNVTLGSNINKNIKRHPTIQDQVIIGAGAKIIGDVNIGAGAKIGANAIIVKDVKQGAVIAAKLSEELKKNSREIEYFI